MTAAPRALQLVTCPLRAWQDVKIRDSLVYHDCNHAFAPARRLNDSTIQ